MKHWTKKEIKRLQRYFDRKRQHMAGKIKQKPSVWQVSTADGTKMFVNEKKAEELMKQGYLVFKVCKRGEL